MQKHRSRFDFANYIRIHHQAEELLYSIFPFELSHDLYLWMEKWLRQPLAFMVNEVGNVMYYHQAMNQPNAWEFAWALVKEVNGHVDNGNWELMPCSKVPEGVDSVPSVWAMHRKWDLVTDQVTKYKACLNLHGSKQELDVNYFMTYAPVSTLMAICFLLIVAILNHWFLRQVDFVMAYTQAPIKCEMYMTLPQEVSTWFGCAKDYVLQLVNNIYRQKQVDLVWYSHILD